MSKRLVPTEVEVLADRIGSFIQHWGFRKIHGIIWTHVWLSKNPIDATTIVNRLGVSKALVSLAIKDLLEYEVLQIIGHNRRKILLVANQDVQKIIANVLRTRETKMLQSVMESNLNVQNMPEAQKTHIDLDEVKLNEMKAFIQIAQMSLATVITEQFDL